MIKDLSYLLVISFERDNIFITVMPQQSAMARAALGWSRLDLAQAAGIGVATVVRFENGQAVTSANVAAMRSAMEAKRVRFVDEGSLKGAVYGGLRKA
jgi:ribosome-binding protein aMBF1 (putative translation factor)